jgi:hypothetical protein
MPPDSTAWATGGLSYDNQIHRYHAGYINQPAAADSHRHGPVIISMAVEEMPVPIGIAEYSSMRRELNKVHWQTSEVFEPPPRAYQNAIYFTGRDTTSQAMRRLFKGFSKLFVAHMIYKSLAVEIVGMAHEDDFDRFQPTMRKFVESFSLSDCEVP